MHKTGNRKSTILLVEDDPDDVFLIERALEGGKEMGRLVCVNDGEEAMLFLRRKKPYQKAERPDLILLDLNMPRKNGCEVLSEIKEDSDLCTIPVIVLTTSGSREDIKSAYQLRANCFISKPSDWKDLNRILSEIQSFWLRTVSLPA
ncbi:MAG: response regulator [Candidatus Sumerlaeia bacterium]